MAKPFAILGQALLYALFATAIAGFSHYPRYQHLAGDQSLLKLSFSHPGQLKVECRRRGADELAKLPPNMRNPLDCPRERSPVTVELDLDGNALARAVIPPSGLSRDGPSTIYARFPVKAGPHQIAVRMNDSVRERGFNYTREEQVSLRPGQILVVDFNAEKGGIVLQ
ncbi:MAG: hypothetical protein ACKVQA_09070 [Burkholderiales bacterium]